MQREFVSTYTSAGQRWYYISEQLPQEHLLFQQASLYANKHEFGKQTTFTTVRMHIDAVTKGVPHASFPIAHHDGHIRESIEVKLLVLY